MKRRRRPWFDPLEVGHRRRAASPAAPIDWGLIHQRLDESVATRDETWELSPAQVEALLAQRVDELAQITKRASLPATTREVVFFSLAGEPYALPSAWVLEVTRFTDFTPLPATPDFVVGLTRWHGEVLLVIDLRRFLNLPFTGLTDRSRLLVLGDGQPELGILADQVSVVDLLDTATLSEPTAGPRHWTTLCARHYARRGGGTESRGVINR